MSLTQNNFLWCSRLLGLLGLCSHSTLDVSFVALLRLWGPQEDRTCMSVFPAQVISTVVGTERELSKYTLNGWLSNSPLTCLPSSRVSPSNLSFPLPPGWSPKPRISIQVTLELKKKSILPLSYWMKSKCFCMMWRQDLLWSGSKQPGQPYLS